MIILTIQNLHKAFGGNVVLKDVSFTLQDRQRMGLVGVNGCGKTTLLRILAGTADGPHRAAVVPQQDIQLVFGYCLH